MSSSVFGRRTTPRRARPPRTSRARRRSGRRGGRSRSGARRPPVRSAAGRRSGARARGTRRAAARSTGSTSACGPCRLFARSSSIATFVAIVNTHARRWRPCSSRSYARSARRNVSCQASSARCAEQPPQVAEHLVAMREVEALERRDLVAWPSSPSSMKRGRVRNREMRRRRPRRVGRVRPRAAHAAPRARSCTPSASGSEPAGGGAVVARQLALLAGRCELFTALGDDELGRESASAGSRSSASTCTSSGAAETRRAWTHVDGSRRAHDHRARRQAAARRPAAARRLRPRLLRRRATPRRCARRGGARSSPATVRELPTLQRGGVELDLLVGSANDPGERYDGSLDVRHCRAHRRRERRDARRRALRRRAAPAPIVDTYGAGDSFAAALAFALARGDALQDALELAARAGAAVIGGAGPYEAQLAFPRVSARVSWISLTPVKATMLHLVDEAELLESGVRGDRRFYFVTERGRLVNNKDHGPLQLVRADYDADADALTLRFADGERGRGEVERGEEVETTFHKRPRAGPRRASGRGRRPCRSSSGEPVRLVEPELPGDRPRPQRRGDAARDRRRSAALAQQLGVDAIDRRRFRMNFGVEGLDAARGGRVARPARAGRRRGRRPAGQRRPLRDHDPEPRHGLHRPRHAEGPRGLPQRRRDDRAAAVRRSTPRSPSPAASGSATPSSRL